MRLIDADALIKNIVKRLCIRSEEYLTAQESVIVSEIYNAPTIESKQGEWIGEADGYADGESVYDIWYCSNCDYVVDDELPTWNYCPSCGAKMKGNHKESE